MIGSLLEAVGSCPGVAFHEGELTAGFDFDALRASKFVRLAGRLGEGDTLDAGQRLLTLVRGPDGTLEGVDLTDPYFHPIAIDDETCRLWELDLEGIAARFQKENGWTGRPTPLSHRLFFLGEAEPAGERTAFVLCLASQLLGSGQLQSLPGFLPSFTAFVALSSNPIDPLTEQQLRALRIEVVLLNRSSPFLVQSRGGNLELAFLPSDDYKTVTKNGKPFYLNDRAAAIVRVLHRAHRSGNPSMHWTAIKKQLQAIGFEVDRMQDPFKAVTDWRELIRNDRRGYWSLIVS